MDSDRDAYLDEVLIGGRESVSISIVEYDPRWPELYREWAKQVRQVLGDRALSVDHIGSTSVPGLAAKPIIDILVTVANVEDETAYIGPLTTIGLVLRVREPEHRMLRTPARDIHLHVYEPQNAAVQNYRDLRDWLRGDRADRELYAETKRQLARQPWSDMNHYAEAKTEVISRILSRARQ